MYDDDHQDENTDPVSHLRALPEYPEGTRVAEQDERFWAAKNSDGSVCVFVEGIQARNLPSLARSCRVFFYMWINLEYLGESLP